MNGIYNSWRLFSFVLKNLIKQADKGSNERTEQKEILICNHCIALLSFVWRAFIPYIGKGRIESQAIRDIIDYAASPE